MKPKSNPFLSRLAFVALSLTLGQAAHAASFEWKGSTTGLTGGTNQTWDTNTTANWWDGVSTVTWPALGGTDDDAVFGGTAGSVTVTTATANDITFNTTGYTLTGGTLTLNGTTPTISNGAAINASIASKISGAAGLTKAGNGILTLSGANDYTGTTTVSAGILKAGNAAALGNAADGTTVSSGATLDIGGQNLGAEVVTISGTGVGGSGAIINTGGQQINALRFVTLDGNATVGVATRWDIRAVGTSTLDLGGFTLTKSGAAYMGVVAANVTNPGHIIINEGELNLSTGTNLNGSSANSITVNNTGTLGMYQSASAHNWTLNLNTGSTLRGENGGATQNIWAGAVNLAGNVSLLAENGQNLTIRGNMSGAANIEKRGLGTLILSGNNTHNGTTTITAGSLQIDHNNALGAGTAITMSGLDSSSLLLGNGVTAGSGKTITIIGAGTGTAFGALSTSAGNAGTAEWQGAVTIGAALSTRVGTNDGNLLISGNIGESAAGSELIFRNNRSFSTVFLTGSNSFTGSPLIASGITSVASIGNSGVNSPLGQNGTIRLGLTNVNGANLTYTGGAETTDKVIDLSSTTGAVTIDQSGSGLLKFSSNFTATGLGAKTLTLQGSTAGTGEIAGAIVENSTTNRTNVIKAGIGTWVLSGNNTYTGTTAVNAGTLKLDYSTNNASKLSDVTSALTLGGGTIELAGGSHTEIVLSTTLAGNTRSLITRSSGTSVLQLNTVTRNTGATLDFAADNIAQIDNANTNGIIGGWATVGGNTWAVNSTNGADGLVTGLASYSLTSVAGDTAANYLNNNMTVDSSQTPGAVITPNSLRFNDANARTLTLATGNNIVTTGGIMVTPTVGSNLSTITGGTLTMPTAGGTLTFHQNNSAGKLVVGSIVANNTGVVALAKTGAGEVELTNSANTFTGSIAVNAGTLTLNGNLPARGAAITVGNIPGQTATLNIQGDIPMAAQQINIASGGSGAVGIVNQSAGTVSFTGGNGLLIGQAAGGVSGTYHLSGGTLSAPISATRGVMIGVNDGTAGNPINATFNLSGTGNLSTTSLQVVRGDSTSSFHNSTYNQTAGTAAIGTLLIGGNGANGANSTATFSVTGGTFAATTAFSNLSRGNNVSSTMTIGGTADVTLPAFPTARGNGSTATLHFDGGTLKPAADSTAYLGGLTNAFIQDGGAKFDTNAFSITVSQNLLTHATSTGGGLTKQGAGTLNLTGTNTYTGNTTVTGGTLLINGSISTSVLTTVQTGAILGGTGSVGALTIEAGGTHAPGNSPGIQPVGDYIQNGTLSMEINGLTAGTQHDRVDVTGTVNITGSTLSLSSTGYTAANNDLIFILLNNDSDAITGTFSGLANGASVGTIGGLDFQISYFADFAGNSFTGGNDIALMAIPEPNAAALLGTLGTLILLRRRRAARVG